MDSTLQLNGTRSRANENDLTKARRANLPIVSRPVVQIANPTPAPSLNQPDEPLPPYSYRPPQEESEEPPPPYDYPGPTIGSPWPNLIQKLVSALRCDRFEMKRMRRFLVFQLQMDYEVVGKGNTIPTLCADDEAHFLDLSRRLSELRDSKPFVQDVGHLCEYLDPYLIQHLRQPASALGLSGAMVVRRVFRFARFHRASGAESSDDDAPPSFDNSIYLSGTDKIVSTFNIRMLAQKIVIDKLVAGEVVRGELKARLRARIEVHEKRWFSDAIGFLLGARQRGSRAGGLTGGEEAYLSSQAKRYWAQNRRQIRNRLRGQRRDMDIWLP